MNDVARNARRLLTLAIIVLGSVSAAEAGEARALVSQPSKVRGATPTVTAGDVHTCALIGDGAVRCWGENGSGQLGDGTTTPRFTPVTVPTAGLGSVAQLVAGTAHTCAITSSGLVRCWGENGLGQLGDTTTTDRPAPVAVSGLADPVAIAAGGAHSCAVRAGGTVVCWGGNGFGQLGDGTTANRSAAVVAAGLSNVVALAAGASHTCALRADGVVRCWGRNTNGQLGDGTTTNQNLSVAVSGLTDAVALAAGGDHTCAIRAGGTVVCWGANGVGQVGDGTTVARSSPAAVLDVTMVKALEAGAAHSCAIRTDGSVRCWGANDSGQLGDGSFTDRPAPVAPVDLTNASAIAAGGSHTCVARADGTFRCWGANDTGQLGDGSTQDNAVPIVVALNGSISAIQVVTGLVHSCAARAEGRMACWGSNLLGQIGDGTTTQRLSPVAVSGLTNVVKIAVGESHTCAVRGDGRALCWGQNNVGQLGDGTFANRPAPVLVFNPVNNVPSRGLPDAVALAAGSHHTCALRADGTVRCWGRNVQGQLGTTAIVGGTAIAIAAEITGVVALAAGPAHTCALRSDGTVHCWGSNADGQLGDGTTLNRFTPVAVPGLTNVVALTAGGPQGLGGHTCALRADAAVRCWGRNDRGQLGNGGTASSPSPVPITTGLTNPVAIGAGGQHTCAVQANGIARCWGENGNGRLGDGTVTDRLAPVTVTRVFGRNVIALDALGGVTGGLLHTCSLQLTGAPFCWGSNAFGQVGDGTTVTERLRAVEVPSFRFNVDPAVTLQTRRVATVVALINCPVDQQIKIEVTLEQGTAFGRGKSTERCTGALERYEVRVTAHGRAGFHDGAGTAEANAVVRRRGDVLETHEWTRNVELAVAP